MKQLLFILLFTIAGMQAQTYQGPIAKPISGYGADGTYTVTQVAVNNPVHTQNVQVYYPTGTTTVIPTIFFAHGFTLNNPNYYQGFINFLVSKGYAVVFVPYPIATSGNYNILEQGFKAAATNLTNIIDTSRVGFIGHSFGAGAIFSIANNLFTNEFWGTNGKFLMPISQWYAYFISQTQLQSFNASTKLVTIITENENVTDHRMAIDMFNNINISNAEKDIVYIKPNTVSGYNYLADHYTSLTSTNFDALDYYAIYRLADALADYTFTGNLTAKNIALGNGSTAQVQMPAGLNNLVVNDAMVPLFPESTYSSPCSDALNPRASYCSQTLSVNSTLHKIKLLQNPVQNTLQLQMPNTAFIKHATIYNMQGKVVLNEIVNANTKALSVPVNKLATGMYLVKIQSSKRVSYIKFFKQ